jgi:hypothetical protein
MANIRKRSGAWFVQIRRTGHPHIYKIFKLKADAVSWVHQTEAILARGGSVLTVENIDIKTLKGLLIKYRDEIVVSKRSAAYETIMINAFLKSQIASLELSKIKPHHFASYRDQRLKSVSGVTVAREFTIYSHAFKTAIQEWGYLDMVNRLLLIKTNEATASAATAYFWLRVIHYLFYTAGISYIRIPAFIGSWLAQMCIVYQILSN